MPQKLIDQTTIQPDGKPGDDAFTAFATCNDNFQDAEARLVALEAGGGETGDRLDSEIAARTAADTALGLRIDAEHTLITQETVDRIAAVQAEALARTNADAALSARMLGKNRIINGNFDIYQRGNPGTVTNAAAYTADRWICSSAGAGVTSNWGIGATPPGQIQDSVLFLGFNVVAGVSSAWVGQWIEGVHTFAGGKATVSFWMRGGVAGKKVGLLIQQHFGTGGSAMVELQASSVITLTTTFTKYTVTFDVPSIVGKTVGNNNALLLTFFYSDDRSSMFGGQLIGQTGLFELAQVQMERGDKATDYAWRPASEELLLCQRYGELIAGEEYPAAAFAANDITTYAKYRVPKRTTPSIAIKTTGTWVGNGGIGTVSTLVTGNIGTSGFRFDATAFTGSVVAGYSYVLRGTSFFVDAEF
ncbi:MAG: putative phage tail fiber protein [Stenotrophomonas indicatrix]|jgi:hypothetical protein|uniref:hypothetical protein n=1 Tax=Stenotrophomonas indicatrix TaxID=2045451 RepID=UPI001CBC19F2|nr:hypothetical protein [Stenotrophomonas indicatrix]MDF2483283.1 putative phage tail fiber protein [Stenotrophomonas indicatrix]